MHSFSLVAEFKITITSRYRVRDKPLYLTLPDSYKTIIQPGLIYLQIMIILISKDGSTTYNKYFTKDALNIIFFLV